MSPAAAGEERNRGRLSHGDAWWMRARACARQLLLLEPKSRRSSKSEGESRPVSPEARCLPRSCHGAASVVAARRG
jgi:hypothetical protein